MGSSLLPPDLIAFQRAFASALDAPATGAVAVYRNTVFHGAVEALRANYPVVEQILGPEMFAQVAVDHAAESPPTRPVLALYGAGFADWLEEQPWVSDMPYLADVARVERLRVESLMATDAVPLSVADISRLNAAESSISLHPAVRFAWLSTPAMSIWLAHQQPFASSLEPAWKPEGALFARPSAFTLHAPRIGRAAHRLLFGIRLGETVADSMAAAAKLYPEEDCGAVFASLVNLGVFVAPNPERT